MLQKFACQSIGNVFFSILFLFVFTLLILRVLYIIFSELCGTDNIVENEIADNAANMIDVENEDIDEMEIDSLSVSSELQEILGFDGSDDSRPNSRQTSRPNSNLSHSFESQAVNYFLLFPKV